MLNINVDARLNSQNFIQNVQNIKREVSNASRASVRDFEGIDMNIKKVARSIAGLAGITGLYALANQITRLRGEFQALEVAFEVMLNSKEKADRLMQQAVQFAATTPFDLQGVAAGTKQLLAYGSAAEDVMDEMKMLGDIAAGLSIPLNDIVYLYGTTRTQGRMYTMDLRQFMGRGIPLAEELAKQFGVTKDKVGELVTEGAVGFEHMQKALVDMTSQGGKFYNLMDKQSETIKGQLSNLGDAVDQMFNDIGKANEGVISDVLKGAGYLVENYEKVGKVLLTLIAAYGTYRTSLMLVATAKKVLNSETLKNIMADASAAAATGLQTAESARAATAITAQAGANVVATTTTLTFAGAMKALKVATLGATKALLLNPYTLVAAAVAAVVYGLYQWCTAESDLERAHREANEEISNQQKIAKEGSDAIKGYINIIKDETQSVYAKAEAYRKLNEEYADYMKNMDEEKMESMSVTELNASVDEFTLEENIKNFEDLIERTQKAYKDYENTFHDYENFGTGDIHTKDFEQKASVLSSLNYKTKQSFWGGYDYLSPAEIKEEVDIKLEEYKKELDRYKKEKEYVLYNAMSDEEKLIALQEKINEKKKEFDLLNNGTEKNNTQQQKKLDELDGEIRKLEIQKKKFEESNNKLVEIKKKVEEREELIKERDAIMEKAAENGILSQKEQSRVDELDGFISAADKSLKQYDAYVKKREQLAQKAEQDRQKAEQERQKMEEEAQKAEQERQKAEREKDQKFREEIETYEDMFSLDKRLSELGKNDKQQEQELRIKYSSELEFPNGCKSFKELLDYYFRTGKLLNGNDLTEEQKKELKLKYFVEIENEDSFVEKLNKVKAMFENIKNAELAQEQGFGTQDMTDKIKLNMQAEMGEILGVDGTKYEDFQSLLKDLLSEEGITPEKAMQIVAEIDFSVKNKDNIKDNKGLTKFFEDLERRGTKSLKGLNKELQDIIDMVNGNNGKIIIGGDEIDLTEQELIELQKQCTVITKMIERRNPFEALHTAYKNLQKDLEEDAGGAIEDYVTASSEAIMDIIQKASAATDFVKGFFESVGFADGAKTMEMISTFFRDIETGANIGGEVGGGWGALIGAVVGTLQGFFDTGLISKWFGTTAGKLNELSEEFNALSNKLEMLKMKMQAAFDFKDKAEYYRQGLNNIKEQLALVARQKELLEEKSSSKRDDEAIANAEKTAEDLKRQAEDLKNEYVETFTGTSINSAIDSFGDRIYDAIMKGEDAFDALNEGVDDLIKNAIKNYIKLNILKPKIDEAMQHLANGMEDGVLTEEEVENYRSMIQNAGAEAANFLEKSFEALNFDFGIEDDETLKGAIKGITEATASVLTGQMVTMIQRQAESLGLLRQQCEYQAQIADNTSYNRGINDCIKDIYSLLKKNNQNREY